MWKLAEYSRPRRDPEVGDSSRWSQSGVGFGTGFLTLVGLWFCSYGFVQPASQSKFAPKSAAWADLVAEEDDNLHAVSRIGGWCGLHDSDSTQVFINWRGIQRSFIHVVPNISVHKQTQYLLLSTPLLTKWPYLYQHQHLPSNSGDTRRHPTPPRPRSHHNRCSRGIGRAITIHLASLGASVVLAFQSNSTLADLTVAEINALLPRAVSFRADISDPSAVKSLFDYAETAFSSPVHILVNNAGIMDPSFPAIAATPTEEWDRTFSVNTRGTFLCSREAANRLFRGGGGRIVNVTSSLVTTAVPGSGAYTASKAAVEAMTKIMAKELKGTGITANCVAPGPIATEMFYAGRRHEEVVRMVEESPLGRIGETGDVAAVVGFIVSGAGEWINGQVVVVNGGFV